MLLAHKESKTTNKCGIYLFSADQTKLIDHTYNIIIGIGERMEGTLVGN
jgi:hypothetical protein